MKILQLSTYFHPLVGGVERQVEEIAVHLQENGHQVTVFTTDATHGKPMRMQRLDEDYRGLKIRRFHTVFKIGYFFQFAPMLAFELFRADYDLIHVHNFHDAHLLFAMLAKVFRKKKLVITGHNPFVVSSEKRGGLLQRLVGIYDLVISIFGFSIDKYVALLQSEANTVHQKLKLPKEKIAIVPNGIQADHYEQDGEKEKFYQEWNINPDKWDLIVGTVSRINFVKGIQNLKVATQKLPRVLFVFAGGDDGYLSTLKKIFARQNNVIFTEQYLPTNEVADFYAGIDLFLLPSVYEPFGMTVVEAMAQGKVVLATSKGGPSEILPTDVGAIIDPNDADAWVHKIKEYIDNPERLEAESKLAISAAQQYRWENVITQLVEVYNSIQQ